MNTILVFLSLLCIVLVLNFLYNFLLEFGRLRAKDDSSSANVVIQNVVTTEPEAFIKTQTSFEPAPKKTTIDLVTKKIPISYGVVEDGAVLSQVKKRVLISSDFIHWLNSFRKQDVFVTKFRQNTNPAVIELISLFSSDTPETFALQLPNNTDLIVVKLVVDNNGTKSVAMYSSLPGCPGWASALVDVAAVVVSAAAAAKQYEAAKNQEAQKKLKAAQERQKTAKTQEMRKLFQATYDALSAESKQEYAGWGSEQKFEGEDLASCIFLAHWACMFNDVACLDALKVRGANFDIPDNNGYTPAHYAAENGFDECLEILKAGGANFNIQDSNGQTPVHCVPREGVESLKILKAGGADFNIKDHLGQTLVHYATWYCSGEFLDELKACGANFDIQDNRGYTPVHVAVEKGYEKRLKTLKAYGANFDIQDNNGQTAREIASNKGINIDDL